MHGLVPKSRSFYVHLGESATGECSAFAGCASSEGLLVEAVVIMHCHLD